MAYISTAGNGLIVWLFVRTIIYLRYGDYSCLIVRILNCEVESQLQTVVKRGVVMSMTVPRRSLVYIGLEEELATKETEEFR